MQHVNKSTAKVVQGSPFWGICYQGPSSMRMLFVVSNFIIQLIKLLHYYRLRLGQFIVNCLFTKSEVFSGKSLTDNLPYCRQGRDLIFSWKTERSRLISCFLHSSFLAFCRPVISLWALRENNALVLANQSARSIGYKPNSYDDNF